MNNQHKFSRNLNGFRMSPMLQEIVSYVGQLDVYEKGAEALQKLTGVEISAMQINKITDYYGARCGTENELSKPVLSAVDKQEKMYLGLDGSMIFTRDEKWKEVKLGRVFKAADCIKSSDGNVGRIRHSHYIAHLGGHKEFCQKMEQAIDAYGLKTEQLIFLSDGAPWIKNWIEDAYNRATSILDFYHAKEHLCDFAKVAFTDSIKKDKWVTQQSKLLLESKLKRVIENIKKQTATHCQTEAEQLRNYYEQNADRMDYKKYKQLGCGIIGSGAIESAHRTVIQKRCKLSGQRWSKNGVQNMLNLKATYMNEQWRKVVNFIRKDAA